MRTVTALCRLSLGLVLFGASACSLLPNHRVTYNQADAQVGIEDDPSISRKSETRNAHPAQLTTDQVHWLLSRVQVSGWSGTLMGIFVSPQPVPLLSEEELQKYSGPVTEAFTAAGPSERVFFSFPKPGGRYSQDRTAGALFLRDRFFHVVVTDHSSILRADTGGDDLRDVRDTKGMKLWTAKPAQPAAVPDAQEPNWAPFEATHLSLNVGEVLALRTAPAPVRVTRDDVKPSSPPSATGPSREDLQNQVRELTNSNLELRERLDDQAKRMKELTEEMHRLRQELDQSKPAKSTPRKTPSP